MAPKKSRAQASSSQPVAEPPRASRARTRRDSDVSNVSDRPSSSQSTVSVLSETPAKRRRKAKTTAQAAPEVIVEEEEVIEEVVEEPEATAVATAVAVAEAVADEIAASTNASQSEKHVRFGDTSQETQQSFEDDVTTATHITPHPRKMSIKRRISSSPSAFDNTSAKRLKITSTRTSLPPALSQEQDPFYILEQHQFAPLRDVLRERVKRRSEVHGEKDASRIYGLKRELETQRQYGNEARVQELDAKIQQLLSGNKDSQELITLDTDVLDDNMLVLDSQEEVAYPQLPKLSGSLRSSFRLDTKRISDTTSQETTVADAERAAWNAERRNFEDAILALSRESNDAKARLRILEIELQALGAAGEGVSTTNVLISIRESFNRVRESLEIIMPGALAQGVSNSEVIDILIANLQEFAERLQTQDKEMSDKSVLVADLGNQVHQLVDHLAEAEIRRQKLEQRWAELDSSNEEKSIQIEDLLSQLQDAQDECDTLQEEVDEKVATINKTKAESLQFARHITSLSVELEEFKIKEAEVRTRIEDLEAAHAETIKLMSREHAAVVDDLASRLDAETAQRSEAQKLAAKRQENISILELRIVTVEAEKKALDDKLISVTAELDTVHEDREAMKVDLDEREAELKGLGVRVGDLEDQLILLNGQLTELREYHLTEKSAREAAEEELAERNAAIDDISAKLAEKGKQANELRSKLFEVQQINASKIKELEESAEQHQVDIANEVELRQAADELAEQRAATIVELELNIKTIEEQMAQDLEEKNLLIADLVKSVARKDNAVKALHEQLETTVNAFNTREQHHTQQCEAYDSSIAALNTTITEKETAISLLEQEAERTLSLHNSEIEDRNTTIADLHHQVHQLRVEIKELAKQKNGLDSRLTEEKAHLAQLEQDKNSEIASLKATIEEQYTNIKIVENKAHEADRRWQDVLAAREEELASMRMSMKGSTETVTTLTSQMDTLKQKFREYVQRSAIKISSLQEALQNATDAVTGESEGIRMDGERVLGELEAMDFVGELTTTTKTQTYSSGYKQQAGRKVAGKKKRFQDSGIGMDAEEELLEG